MRSPGNSKYLKKLNRMTVLNVIKEHECVSRQQIAEVTGLTPPAITGIIRELLDMNFVKEVGLGKSQGGRKPVKLKFNCKAGYIIGLEITHSESTIAIADLKNDPTGITTTDIDMSDPEQGVPLLIQAVRELISQTEYSQKSFLGIGIAFPGLLRIKEGIVKRAINLGPKWNDFPLKEVLEKEFGIPVFIEMNSKAAVLAEKWFGGGVDYKDLIYVNLGEGISAGILLNDCVVQGARGHAGQIGHIVLAEDGPLCNCGNRGCLEAICGIPALLRKVRAELPLISKEDPLAKVWQESGRITFNDILGSAGVEGTYSRELLRQVGKNVGLALATMVNMYNPEAVFIGGRMSAAGEVLLDVIGEVVSSHVFPEVARMLVIKLSRLGSNSGVIGACALVLKELLQSPESVLLDDVRLVSEKQEKTVYWSRF